MGGGKQQVMAGIDTDLSAACDIYVDILEEQQELMEKKNKAANILIQAMKGAGRGQVRHRGRTLIIEEIEAQTKIKVSKFVENKKA
jgi:hypothetical protein